MEYSVARALHHLERYSDAQDAYNAFLRRFTDCSDPDGLRVLAQEYLALAIQQERTARDQAAVINPNAESPPPADDWINPGWYVLGAGGTQILTGIIVDLAFLSVRDDKQEAADNGDVDEFNRLDEQLDRVVVAEYVLFGAGIAASITGVVLLLVLDGDAAEQEVTVGIAPIRGGSMVGISGRF